MAIIIKCEMPSCCGVCHECDYSEIENGYYCAVDGKFRTLEPPRPAGCPIIGEIPDTHGRLADVDAIIRQLRKWGDAPIKRDNFEIANLLESLAETDAVLEASK